MSEIPILSSTKQIQDHISSKGKNFRIAPTVSQLKLQLLPNSSPEKTTRALQESRVQTLSISHSQSVKNSVITSVLNGLYYMETLENLEIESDRQAVLDSVGILVRDHPSIKSLKLSSFGTLDPRSFLSYLPSARSLSRLTLASADLAECHRIVSSLPDRPNSRISIETRFFDSIHPDALSADNLRNTPVTFKIDTISQSNWEERAETNLEVQQLFASPIAQSNRKEPAKRKPDFQEYFSVAITQSNWEDLAKKLRAACSQQIIKVDYAADLNMNTKAFVDKLALHTLTQEVTATCLTRNKLQETLSDKLNRSQLLFVQREQLRKQLEAVESELLTVEDQITTTSDTLSDTRNALKNLESNVNAFQSSLEVNDPALQAWQRKLQTDISEWSGEDVATMLAEIGLGGHSESFAKNSIDGAVLEMLNTNDLITLNVSFKNIKKLMMYRYLVQTHHDIYTIPPGVLQWNNETVCTWLEDNKFAHLVDTFKNYQITGAELAFLDEEDLSKQLKIKALGDIKKLHKEITRLKDSLRDDKALQDRLKNNENKPSDAQLARQLDELKVFNEELKRALKEKSTKIPDAFVCPITQDMMQEPVVLSDGHTYERTAIELWLQNHNTSPMTGLQLSNKQLTPSHTLKSMICAFIDANKKK